MTEFFSMGGYAIYVWPAFVITAVVLIANVFMAVSLDRRVRKRNQRRIEAQK